MSKYKAVGKAIKEGVKKVRKGSVEQRIAEKKKKKLEWTRRWKKENPDKVSGHNRTYNEKRKSSISNKASAVSMRKLSKKKEVERIKKILEESKKNPPRDFRSDEAKKRIDKSRGFSRGMWRKQVDSRKKSKK